MFNGPEQSYGPNKHQGANSSFLAVVKGGRWVRLTDPLLFCAESDFLIVMAGSRPSGETRPSMSCGNEARARAPLGQQKRV